ncbi:PPE family protein [Mycobacterium sp.]|uniref:PPE family protein n=1 Tax=Mycobacterium sp. TaxID=1785 RepID=UPI0025FB4221|nr:PPE family protein [Mycobacterium sp.]MBW0012316.1 PPE family protein [Mycobacterium sp.]
MIPAFTLFPPEINSALMFGGAGSGPLFSAAQAWDGLASDLAGAASSFDSVVTGLTSGPWAGPASVSMAAAAAPYVGWLSAAAGQAEAAAAQARAAASAFEAALTMTIPTAAVSANRARLLALIATNILGQNTPAIAMTEFEYIEMWATDVAAMVGYHAGATGVAAALPSFSLPPVGLAGLSGVLASTPLSGVTSGLSSLTGSVAPALTSALSPVVAPIQGVASGALSQVTALYGTYGGMLSSASQIVMYPASMAMSPIMMAAQAGMSAHPELAAATAPDMAAAAGPKFVGDAMPKGLGGGAGLGGVGGAAPGLGQARLVGAMSVPSTWQGSSPARMVSAAMSGVGGELGAGMPAAMAGAGSGTGMMPMPMPMGGGAGGGMPGGMLGRGGASPNHVVQNRPSVVPRTGV